MHRQLLAYTSYEIREEKHRLTAVSMHPQHPRKLIYATAPCMQELHAMLHMHGRLSNVPVTCHSEQ